MAEGKQKLKEKGLDKLTFYCLPNKTVRVCRKTTPTWQDLLCELQTQTGFQANAIEVAINTEKVYYDGRTKLADIVIDQKDKLYVMCRPSFKSESQQKRYEADVIKKKQKCQQAIQSRNEQVEVLRLVSLMESNPDYAALLKELESQFGRIEAMIAIETSKGNRREALEFLKSGKAARSAQKIQRAQEEEYLKQLLNQPDQQALKQFIKKNKIDKIGYRGIVLKLYEKYPKFREYEPRHQKLVQQQLFGQVIDSDQSEVDVEPNNNLYYAIVGEILAKAQKQPKLAPQQRQAFIKRMLKEADASTVGAALAQADNNLAAAEEIIREGLVQQVQDFINTTRKSCKRNIVLQFFNRPDFDKIKTSLRGNRKKAQKFVDWVISENKNNLGFSSLFNKYKDYAVTLLSGETSLSNPEKLQKRSIKIYPQLSADQQAKIKKQVDKACNRELVEALRMHGFTAELAEAAVRAARNRPEELAPFLKIQAINQQFDFCPGGPQNEQLYIYLHYRKKRQLLKQLQDPSEMILWLSQLVVLRPLLYEMIVRNKPSFDSLVKRSQTAVK